MIGAGLLLVHGMAGAQAVIQPHGPSDAPRPIGHLPYGEAWRDALVTVPDGFGIRVACQLQREAVRSMIALLAAAATAPGIGPQLRGVSCFRSIAQQAAVFCGAGAAGPCRDAADRARDVGPPGFSEHATGYAVDFGLRPALCPDVEACFASTSAGRWLISNAPKYGFELSFPIGNRQGVAWEPWHWRWVGTSPDAPGAADARRTFARARGQFPGQPAIVDPIVADERFPVAKLVPPAPRVERAGRAAR